MKVIDVPNTTPPIGPYSKAYAAGGFLFTSGQGGASTPSGEAIVGIEAQAEETMKNSWQDF